MFKKLPPHPLRFFARNLWVVIGLVLIWRGVWYILDGLDMYVWGNPSHAISSIVGIVIGMLILYIPDGDLKEIQDL